MFLLTSRERERHRLAAGNENGFRAAHDRLRFRRRLCHIGGISRRYDRTQDAFNQGNQSCQSYFQTFLLDVRCRHDGTHGRLDHIVRCGEE